MYSNDFEKLSTKRLEALLKDDCDGVSNLSLEQILAICRILAQRERGQATDTSASQAWEQFKAFYLDTE